MVHSTWMIFLQSDFTPRMRVLDFMPILRSIVQRLSVLSSCMLSKIVFIQPLLVKQVGRPCFRFKGLIILTLFKCSMRTSTMQLSILILDSPCTSRPSQFPQALSSVYYMPRLTECAPYFSSEAQVLTHSKLDAILITIFTLQTYVTIVDFIKSTWVLVFFSCIPFIIPLITPKFFILQLNSFM